MLALDRRSRAALAALAFAAFATAVVMTVSMDAAPAGAGGDVTPAVTPLPLATRLARTLPQRDPFAGGAPRATTPAPAALPPLPAIPAAIGALPANLHVQIAAARITAIITGAHASALLEEGDTVRVLTPGDAFHGDRVTAIDGAGVHLAGGGTLRVTPAAATLPAVPLPLLPAPSGGRP